MEGESSRVPLDTEDDSLITHDKCNAPRAKIFLVSIVSFVIAACVVLLVVLTRVDNATTNNSGKEDSNRCWFENACPPLKDDKCADVAVVGAGLAGVYATWRLRQSNLSVHLYDMADHAGGQLMSVSWPPGPHPSTHLELGASYFFPTLHTRLANIINQLQFSVKKTWPNVTSHHLYHLRGVMLSEEDIKHGMLPYVIKRRELANMTPLEAMRFVLLEWSRPYPYGLPSIGNTTNEAFVSTVSPTEPSPEPQEKIPFSMHRHLLTNWRYEVYQYLRDALSLPFYHDDLASDIFQDFYGTFDHPDEFLPDMAEKSSIEGGMGSIVHHLLEKTSTQNKRFSVQYHHKLTSIESRPNHQKLEFVDPRNLKMVSSTCSRAVVLALPPAALNQVDITPTRVADAFRPLFDGLQEVAILRTLLVYTEPWWRESGAPWRSIHSYTPLADVREVFVHKDLDDDALMNNKTAVLELTASGNELVQFWRNFLKNGKPYRTETQHLWNTTSLLGNRVPTYDFVRQLQTFLQDVVEIEENVTGASESELPWPRDVIVMEWSSDEASSLSHTYTNHGGMFLWRPAVNRTEGAKNFRSPLRDVNVHMVGSAYSSDYRQMWAEGAIQTVDELFDSHFPWS